MEVYVLGVAMSRDDSATGRAHSFPVVRGQRGGFSIGGRPLRLAGEEKSLADVVDEEGEEESTHEDGGGGGFVVELADAGVVQHEPCVGEEVDECRGDDDSGSELLGCYEDDALVGHAGEFRHEDGGKDTEGAGGEDDEEEADSEGDVVVAVDTLAGWLCGGFAAADAVPENFRT